jgi:hypothetical protein
VVRHGGGRRWRRGSPLDLPFRPVYRPPVHGGQPTEQENVMRDETGSAPEPRVVPSDRRTWETPVLRLIPVDETKGKSPTAIESTFAGPS